MEYTKVNKDTLKLSFNIPINDNKFDIQSDKYLYKGNKTIGFRKDKKLDKFVGLRSGNSKQLEFTIKSIIIDGNEKINTDTLYFNDIELINDTVIHKINDIEIYNKINGANYRNLVKINDIFDEIEIIYKVDLKGVKINNKSYKSNNEIHYLSSHENTFFIVDSGNNKKYFIIDNPIVFTENDEILNIVQHELYEIDNVLYYKKLVRNFKYFSKDINYLPVYIDANIQFNINNYYTLTKSAQKVLLNSTDVSGINNISIWSDFLRKNDNGVYDFQNNSTNLLSIGSITLDDTYYTYNIANNVKLSRHYFSFDTSILSNFGLPIVSSAYFNFYYSTNQLQSNLSLQKSTFLGDIPDTTEWLSFDGNLYNVKNTNTNYFSGTTILTVPSSDIIVDGLSNFLLRSYTYDYLRQLPTTALSIPINNTMVNSSLDVEFTIKLNEPKILTFNLADNGIGVLHSFGSTYDIVKNGVTVINEHSSNIGTYQFAFGYEYKNLQQNLYRTFLSFDTSILGYYNDYNVIKSINLNFVSFQNHRPSVALYKGTQPIIYLDQPNWNNIDSYIGTYDINDIGIKTTINLNKNLFDYSGYTKFVMIDDLYDKDDYYINTNVNNKFWNGIDFSTVNLEVIVEPYLVKGINYKQVINGNMFDLIVSKNIDFGTIKWYNDYNLTNQIGQGNTVTLDSSFYKKDDIIYVIITDGFNTKISSNTLEITLDIITNQYSNLPIYNRSTSYDVVDLDSVYFKYENAISGVCYSYFRDLSDVYENTNMVSDTNDTGSYNLYNEFDIIDEFYSNIDEVEIVARLDDINLNISYKELDGQIIHEGTRVLLYSITPSVNDGIYVANYNLKLIKLSDMTDNELFRYKINVNAGTYLDYEFHTYYYDYNEETNNPSNGTFNFDLFDASLYSEVVINMGTYIDTIYNSNI